MTKMMNMMGKKMTKNIKQYKITNDDGVYSFTIIIDLDKECFLDKAFYENSPYNIDGTIKNDIAMTSDFWDSNPSNTPFEDRLRTFLDNLSSHLIYYIMNESRNEIFVNQEFNQKEGYPSFFGKNNGVYVTDIYVDHDKLYEYSVEEI